MIRRPGLRQLAIRIAIALGACFFTGGSAYAVPPPPPAGANLAALQTFIAGVTSAQADSYEAALAEDLTVMSDGAALARSKADWMRLMRPLFLTAERAVSVEHVYYGADYLTDGPYAKPRAILLERVERVFGDCCVLHRVETLTFDNGKVTRLERTVELDLELKPDGRPQGAP